MTLPLWALNTPELTPKLNTTRTQTSILQDNVFMESINDASIFI